MSVVACNSGKVAFSVVGLTGSGTYSPCHLIHYVVAGHDTHDMFTQWIKTWKYMYVLSIQVLFLCTHYWWYFVHSQYQLLNMIGWCVTLKNWLKYGSSTCIVWCFLWRLAIAYEYTTWKYQRNYCFSSKVCFSIYTTKHTYQGIVMNVHYSAVSQAWS